MEVILWILAFIGFIAVCILAIFLLLVTLFFISVKKDVNRINNAKTKQEQTAIMKEIKKKTNKDSFLFKSVDKLDNPKVRGCCGGDKKNGKSIK